MQSKSGETSSKPPKPLRNHTPIVAIVGRPNVGKSTLFNSLTGTRKSIVSEIAGTTRDRISQKFQCHDYEVFLVDTGGIEHGKQENIEADIQVQAKIAIQDADVILLVVDASQELTTDDFMAADILRKTQKPVILIANKCDNKKVEDSVFNLYELGFGEPIQVSAIHKNGINEVTSLVNKALKKGKFRPFKAKEHEGINLCILGKPNAGKSSLVNALIGSEKIIVSDIPGTTRDSTDTDLTYKEEHFTLIDTAGLRRRGKIEKGIEKYSALRALQGVEKADIIVLLIDGNAGITSQDCHIAEHALEDNKGLIIAINKTDLFDQDETKQNRLISRLRRKFIFVPWAAIIFVSAKNKRNTYKILEQATEIMTERKKRIHTGEFNSFMQKTIHKHLPNSTKSQKPKFMYASQVDINPPKFICFFKNVDNMHFSYPRYIENEIRKEYGFNGTAIEVIFKHNVGKEKPPGAPNRKRKS